MALEVGVETVWWWRGGSHGCYKASQKFELLAVPKVAKDILAALFYRIITETTSYTKLPSLCVGRLWWAGGRTVRMRRPAVSTQSRPGVGWGEVGRVVALQPTFNNTRQPPCSIGAQQFCRSCISFWCANPLDENRENHWSDRIKSISKSGTKFRTSEPSSLGSKVHKHNFRVFPEHILTRQTLKIGF